MNPQSLHVLCICLKNLLKKNHVLMSSKKRENTLCPQKWEAYFSAPNFLSKLDSTQDNKLPSQVHR